MLGVPAPLAAPGVEEVIVAAASELLPPLAPLLVSVAVGAALALILIGLTATPAQAPGLPHLPLVPVDPDKARLAELMASHEAGTLALNDEAELIALLASVKGIRVLSIKDLADANAATLPLKGLHVPLRNFTYLQNFAYTKRTKAAKEALRRKFDSSSRSAFLKHLASDPAKMDRIKRLGMSDRNLERIRRGDVPIDYQVHHKLSLDDGGDNSFDNLVLIKDAPYHRAITAMQNSSTNGLQPGETKVLNWVTVDDYIYPNY